MNKRDYIYIGTLMLIFGIISFYKLGNTIGAQTSWIYPQDDSIIADFGEVREIDEIQFMSSAFIDQEFTLMLSLDNVNWGEAPAIGIERVFFWHSIYIAPYPARYVSITPVSEYVVLQEMTFREKGEMIPIVAYSEGAQSLFDEQEYIPDKENFMNSTYFDEVYHARTAYEFIYKFPPYEWTHPPFGKIMISLGVKVLGMTPFGWRFMGAFFGILMIFPVYLLAKKIFRSEKWAFLTAFIFTFDFMHFTQTRIATVDTYLVFFIVLMYYFMFVYTANEYNKFYKYMIPLALSGLFMGLAISTKWQGVYAAIGLAVIFFASFVNRRKLFTPKQLIITICLCFVFFIFVPIIIYILSYIPFLTTINSSFSIRAIIENTKNIYLYHSLLVNDHPYASNWWSWPLIIRPIFYYAGDLGNGIKQGISAFGNPAVWWTGIPAFLYCIYSSIRHKDKVAIFLVIAYLSQYLPWVFISRETFIYHYFPSVPFVALMVIYLIKNTIYKRFPKSVYIYAALVLGLFIMFYPVLSGMPIHEGYVKYLKWMPTWQLIF